MTKTDFDRAYADVLFAHIDRLNDLCPEDSAEDIAADIVAAFDRVVRLDPRMTGNEPYRALRKSQGWLFPGDKVWAPSAGGSDQRIEVDVQLCFRGRDDDAQCVVAWDDDGKTLYRCHPLSALALEQNGPTLFAQGRLPEHALQALAHRLGCTWPPEATPASTRPARGRRPRSSQG